MTDRQLTEEERGLRLAQLNDLHNQLVGTHQEHFCPALRWAMDHLGCPVATAPPRRRLSIEEARAAVELDDEIYGRNG